MNLFVFKFLLPCFLLLFLLSLPFRDHLSTVIGHLRHPKQFSEPKPPSESEQFGEPKHLSEPQKFDELQFSHTIENDGHPEWEYSYSRDRDNYGLTREQCHSAFPQLYYEIERAAACWQDGRLTPQSIELERDKINPGGVRFLVHNHQLRIVEQKGYGTGWRPRFDSLFEQIERALTTIASNADPIPDTEFTVSVDDIGKKRPGDDRTVWSFSREADKPDQDDVWVMPDFHFGKASSAGREYLEQQARALVHDSPIAHKRPQAFWRGAIAWHADMPGSQVRYALLNATKNQDWADVERIWWERDRGTRIVPLEKYCDYRYLVNTEGVSFSSRLTYIFHCDSVPIVHESPYIAHYYHLLEPNVNCVPVSRDFSDLGQQVDTLSKDLKTAQEIADRARKTFRERYITAAATNCYWREMLYTWASVAFKPEVTDRESGKERGVTIAEFKEAHKH